MPLRNRVTPLGDLIATPARGHVFGNRGCLHDARGEIVRFAASKRWIACRLRWKDWRRTPLMQPGRYTELFFLDEATAFAAGHRPCALCRREDYRAAKAAILTATVSSDDLDALLEGERREGSRRRLHTARYEQLPDGAFVVHRDTPSLLLSDCLYAWTPTGYGPPQPRPTGIAQLITPPSLVELLRADWRPAVPLISPELCPPSRPPT